MYLHGPPGLLLQPVRPEVRRLPAPYHRELHLGPEQAVAPAVLRLQAVPGNQTVPLLTHLLKIVSSIPGTVPRWRLLRARGFSLLRDALPRAAGVTVCRLPQTNLRPLHHRHVQEVPSRALRMQVTGNVGKCWVIESVGTFILLIDLFVRLISNSITAFV